MKQDGKKMIEDNEEKHTDVELDITGEDLTSDPETPDADESEDKNQTTDEPVSQKADKKILTPEEKKKLFKKKLLIGLLGVVLIFLILLGIPATRWPILNTIGLRGNLEITVQEQVSKKPVSGATVTLTDNSKITTDSFGRATFKNAKLGSQKVSISKSGYGTSSETYTNSFGTTKKVSTLEVVGIKLNLSIKDWLSGNSINEVKVTFQDASGISDEKGLANIVIPPTDAKKVDLELSKEGYITKTLSVETNQKTNEVTLVSSAKNYFISKRDGKFDIFSSNLDGSAQQKIIEATGKENNDFTQFAINRNNKTAILIANREGKVQLNRTITGVYVVDLEKATLKKIDEGVNVDLKGWSDGTISYSKGSPTLNYNDQNFSSLMLLNTTTSKLSQIAQSRYFSVAIVAQSKLFYRTVDSEKTVEENALMSYDISSGAKKVYLTGRVLESASRASYNTIEIEDYIGNARFEIQIASGATKQIDRQSSNNNYLVYGVSPNNQAVLWTDTRDGQGALLTKPIKDGEERVIVRVGGLTNPVRYINDSMAIVRVATSQETADYVVHLQTGKILKIVDVSNISSI